MSIEPLELRIAQAALVGGKLTYTDMDGDLVTILFSKKTGLDEADFVFNNAFATTGPQSLLRIDLADDTALANTSITMKVTKVGDGHADVGAIIANGLNLGAVKILGDLRQIVAGSGQAKTFSIKSLSALSFGVQGASALPADLLSTLTGKFGKIAITGDIENVGLNVFDFSPGARSTSFTAGGKLKGGTADGEGVLLLGSVGSVKLGGIVGGIAGNPLATFSPGGALLLESVGSLTITGDVVGGNVFRCGAIDIGGKAGKVVIGGKLIGGHAQRAGHLKIGGAAGSVTVGGVVGGNLEFPGDFVVGGGSGAIDLQGGVGVLTVKDGIVGGSISNAGSIFIDGNAKVVSITGDLTGSSGSGSGAVQVAGDVTVLKINGSLLGGTGDGSGRVRTDNIVSATVTGDLVGTDTISSGIFSLTGGILARKVTIMKIIGSILGGDGRELAGGIEMEEVKTFTLTGSLEGGAAEQSGQIEVEGSGTINILGGIKGGGGEESGLVLFESSKSLRVGGVIEGGAGNFSGSVQAQGIAGVVTVGGLKAGTGILSGSLVNVVGNIKAVLVKGDVVGQPSNPVHLGAAGGMPGVTLGSVTVLGKVEHARITAGFFGEVFANADASIGKVTIGKDFAASVIAAGVNPQGNFFGDGNDTVISGGGDPAIAARIGPVLIKGAVFGTAAPTTDSFGIVAQEVVKVTVGNQAVAVTPLASNDTAGVLIGGTTDVHVREV